MKLAALISGGKDSIFAMYEAIKKGNEIEVIIAIKSENPESYMFHIPNIELVKLQAQAMKIPLIFKTTKGEKEKELEDLKAAFKEAKEEYEIEGIISGALFSKYQKERIDRLCAELDLESLAPLWKRKPKDMWQEMLKFGFRIIFSGVAAYGLDESWLGKEINQETFERLLNLHNICYVCTGGEGGEFETFVLDCPLFKKKIAIDKAEKKWMGDSGFYEVTKAHLEDK